LIRQAIYMTFTCVIFATLLAANATFAAASLATTPATMPATRPATTRAAVNVHDLPEAIRSARRESASASEKVRVEIAEVLRLQAEIQSELLENVKRQVKIAERLHASEQPQAAPLTAQQSKDLQRDIDTAREQRAQLEKRTADVQKRVEKLADLVAAADAALAREADVLRASRDLERRRAATTNAAATSPATSQPSP
jgi:predicted  nucleic acid-binding Zn-ribbon protein